MPASVAQLDAPSDWIPGGRRFNPRRRQHSFVEIDHEIFSMQAFKRALLFLLFLLFPTFFLCSYFSLLFSENALLSLLFSPKVFEVTKNCNFFPRSLEVCKNWISLI